MLPVGGFIIVSIVSLIHSKCLATFIKTPGYLTAHLSSATHENTPTTVAFPLTFLIKPPGMKSAYFNFYNSFKKNLCKYI